MSHTDAPGTDPRLRESEERYRAVIDNASDMIQSVRPNGTFEFVNKAWLDKLGYTPEDVAGLIVWDIVHPDALEHCQMLFMKAVMGETIDSLETTFVTNDGTPVPVEGSATSRFMGDTVVATHGFFRDITERLRAEELAARNLQLEREQHARYLEKMAALGKLSAGLAHEFNNPAAAAQRASTRLSESLVIRDDAMRRLTTARIDHAAMQALHGLLSDRDPISPAMQLDPIQISEREEGVETWLEDHDIDRAWDIATVLVAGGVAEAELERFSHVFPAASLDPALLWLSESLAVRQLAEVIARSSRRISELVDSIKVYSHMDRAKEQEVDIHDGLESTLIILGHRLRNIAIAREYDRGIPPVPVFGNAMNQVWTNMLDNAVDAMQEHGTIIIRTRRLDDTVRVDIEDDGAGIPPADLACIFEPFFTTKPQGQGTGLGLDTAWRIVTQEHGGTIDVDSEPGRTCMRVSIPLRRVRPDSPRSA